MRLETVIKNPNKHFSLLKKSIMGINIFHNFCTFNQINKHKGKYVIIAHIPKLL